MGMMINDSVSGRLYQLTTLPDIALVDVKRPYGVERGHIARPAGHKRSDQRRDPHP
jgi:hypothetical protein